MLSEHQHETEERQYHKCAGLIVLATVQKMIPYPNVLRQRGRNQQENGQQQQKATDPDKQSSHTYECIEVQPARVGGWIQIQFTLIMSLRFPAVWTK